MDARPNRPQGRRAEGAAQIPSARRPGRERARPRPRPARPRRSAIQLAPGTASGISATTTPNTAVPIRSPSMSPPRRSSSRSGIAQAIKQGQRGTVAAEGDRKRVRGRGGRHPAHATDREQRDHRQRTVPALEQPSVERDRGQGDHGEPGVAVDERRGEQAPPVGARRAEDDQVADADQRRAPEQAADQAEDDEDDRRVRPRLGPDPRDLAPLEPRQRRRGRAPAAALGHPALAVDLRRALTEPVAAVRALGDVRAHLGSAVLADHEQIGAAGAHP